LSAVVCCMNSSHSSFIPWVVMPCNPVEKFNDVIEKCIAFIFRVEDYVKLHGITTPKASLFNTNMFLNSNCYRYVSFEYYYFVTVLCNSGNGRDNNMTNLIYILNYSTDNPLQVTTQIRFVKVMLTKSLYYHHSVQTATCVTAKNYYC
jgi:hypothetical protein